MEKDLIHNLIILDESGSMSSAYDATINAFNQFLGNLKSTALEFPDQEHLVTFLSFNTNGRRYLAENAIPESVPALSRENYKPNDGTPLYDAIGFSANRIREQIEGKPNAKVLVSIFTDGYENASVEFNGSQIRSLVANLEEKGWTFTYFGAEHDVYSAAKSMNIKNSKSFSKNIEQMSMMMMEEVEDRKTYYTKIRNKEANLKDDYFKKKD